MTPQETIANQIRYILRTIGRFDAEYFSVHKCAAGNFKIIAKSEKFFDRCLAKLAPEIHAAESGLKMKKLIIYDGYDGIDFVVALAAKIYEIDAELSTCTVRVKDLVDECMKTGIVETDDFRLQKTIHGYSLTNLRGALLIFEKNPEVLVSHLTQFLLETNDARLLVASTRNIEPAKKEGEKFSNGSDVFINKLIFETFNILKIQDTILIENVLRCDYNRQTKRYGITIEADIAFSHSFKIDVDAKLKANGIQICDSASRLCIGADSSRFITILYIAIEILMSERIEAVQQKLFVRSPTSSITNDYGIELNQIVDRTLDALRRGEQYIIEDDIISSYSELTKTYVITYTAGHAEVLKLGVDKKLKEKDIPTNISKYCLYQGKSEQEFILVLFITLQQLRKIKSVDAVTELKGALVGKNSTDGPVVKNIDVTMELGKSLELKGTTAYLWKPYSDISVYELAVCIPYIHVGPILTIPEDNACNRHFELIK